MLWISVRCLKCSQQPHLALKLGSCINFPSILIHRLSHKALAVSQIILSLTVPQYHLQLFLVYSHQQESFHPIQHLWVFICHQSGYFLSGLSPRDDICLLKDGADGGRWPVIVLNELGHTDTWCMTPYYLLLHLHVNTLLLALFLWHLGWWSHGEGKTSPDVLKITWQLGKSKVGESGGLCTVTQAGRHWMCMAQSSSGRRSLWLMFGAKMEPRHTSTLVLCITNFIIFLFTYWFACIIMCSYSKVPLYYGSLSAWIHCCGLKWNPAEYFI